LSILAFYTIIPSAGPKLRARLLGIEVKNTESQHFR
jgi:hypothetical protein